MTDNDLKPEEQRIDKNLIYNDNQKTLESLYKKQIEKKLNKTMAWKTKKTWKQFFGKSIKTNEPVR